MICPGEYSVRNSIALVVLHVQGLSVDELGRTTGWKRGKLTKKDRIIAFLQIFCEQHN